MMNMTEEGNTGDKLLETSKRDIKEHTLHLHANLRTKMYKKENKAE